jgi:hypothetical protein
MALLIPPVAQENLPNMRESIKKVTGSQNDTVFGMVERRMDNGNDKSWLGEVIHSHSSRYSCDE